MGTKSYLPNSFWSFDPLSPPSHIVDKDALPVRSPQEWRPKSWRVTYTPGRRHPGSVDVGVRNGEVSGKGGGLGDNGWYGH